MAGRGNSYGIHRQTQSPFNGVGGSTGMGNYSIAIGNPGSGLGAEVNHIPDVWTPEEQAILEEGLFMGNNRQSPDVKSIVFWTGIFVCNIFVPNSLREDCYICGCHISPWRKETVGRRNEDNSKKNKDKRERENDSSSKSTQLPSQSGVQSHPVSLDNDHGISYKAIGGPTAELFEQNAQFFRQISINFTSFQIQDNISLFCQARDNIIKILKSVKDTPELMKQMPPIPVKLNQELMSAILPQKLHLGNP